MKKINLLAAAVLAAGALSSSAFADFTPNATFNGYMRSGINHGNNVKGGAFNKNQIGRLGNENDTYGEVAIGADVAKVGDTVWSMQVMFAHGDDGIQHDWSTNLAMRQYYGEVKGLFDGDKDAVLWAGKRFLNREDIHITDHYYYDVSGTGIGLNNVALGSGKLCLSWTQKDSYGIDYELKAGKDADLYEGFAGPKQGTTDMFDVRYNFPVWDGASLQLGLTHFQYERANHTGAFKAYKATNEIGNSNVFTAELNIGYSLGWNKTVYKVVKGSTANGLHWGAANAVDEKGTSNNAYGHQILNFGETHFTDSFGMFHVLNAAVTANYDVEKDKADLDSKKTLSFVVRPYLKLTQMTRLYAEAGFYTDTEKKMNGEKVNKQAQKYTVAYAVTPDAGNFWSRPEIRIFASYVHGNENDLYSSAFGNATNEKSNDKVDHDVLFGAQIEAWF